MDEVIRIFLEDKLYGLFIADIETIVLERTVDDFRMATGRLFVDYNDLPSFFYKVLSDVGENKAEPARDEYFLLHYNEI